MAKVDLSQIQIEKLIIHDIPKHKRNDTTIAPNYSENESAITDGLRLFFQDKIKAALNGEQAFKVCFCAETISPVPDRITSIIQTDDNYIEGSKEIAGYLFDIQSGNNAAGILLIIKGRINNCFLCAIMKLERDSGAQLVLDETTKTFNIAEVEDLMLTKKTKIFKIALFISRDEFGIDYDGVLMDFQINIKKKKDTNSFFLDFLGCIAYADPKITTKRFYNLTRDFINTIQDALIRSKYIQDLNSYLQKNQNIISPREFAEDYMSDTAHKNNYKKHLEIKEFGFESFTKDSSLVDSAINKILIEFENEISILGKDGTFGEKVSLAVDDETGLCRAVILSNIKNIK